MATLTPAEREARAAKIHGEGPADAAWRPIGFWALTINAALGFPAIVVGVLYQPDAAWGTVGAAYASILLAWSAAAGIRQWGKNTAARTYREGG